MADAEQSQQNHEYFAIGSMMNPISLSARGIKPIQSRPAILLDYELRFFSVMGYAVAKPSKGKRNFHGVIHTVSDADMKTLHEIEHIYEPKQAIAELYNNVGTVNVTEYCSSEDNDDSKEHITRTLY